MDLRLFQQLGRLKITHLRLCFGRRLSASLWDVVSLSAHGTLGPHFQEEPNHVYAPDRFRIDRAFCAGSDQLVWRSIDRREYAAFRSGSDQQQYRRFCQMDANGHGREPRRDARCSAETRTGVQAMWNSNWGIPFAVLDSYHNRSGSVWLDLSDILLPATETTRAKAAAQAN